MKLIEAVKSQQLPTIVFPGINQTIVPGVNEQQIPKFNTAPIGPHISGSFEVWVPCESFASVLSWMTLHRGGLSVFIHSLTELEVHDHTD